jgi:hypothetical protein
VIYFSCGASLFADSVQIDRRLEASRQTASAAIRKVVTLTIPEVRADHPALIFQWDAQAFILTILVAVMPDVPCPA